ncbi:uncharacterized protein LOC126396070 [Epinephelus moara]|uniref:uncharacterized protein LOC126396070 n=1 Tax=Epinephelus moara TaxID=300413 RepID=UPI00214E4444|nr:uncharacterized protein LOC126396070 [Epinephelus moara]
MMMMMMMMAWVWISSVNLARLNTAQEPHRDADGALASLEPLFPDIEPPVEPLSRGGFVPVPVWRFVKVLERGGDDGEAADLGQPQYRCSDGSLSVRLSLIRHSAVSLEDGTRLLSLQDGCQASLRTFGPWQLINVTYTSCHMELWVSNGSWFHQLRLRYFDHLLQETVTGVAACQNPATSLQLALPLVTCRSTDVNVKLPLGARLTRVKALGKDLGRQSQRAQVPRTCRYRHQRTWNPLLK